MQPCCTSPYFWLFEYFETFECFLRFNYNKVYKKELNKKGKASWK